MTGTIQYGVKAALRCAVIFGTGIFLAYGQQPTMINLGTQGRNVDFSNAPSTRPVKTGTALPASCSPGDLFFNTTAPAGQNLFGCSATNIWALQGASGTGTGSGLSDPGANGLVVRTALNTTTSVPAPAGAVVGTTDLQTLTNKSIDASEIATGVLLGAQMPAFSGDILTSAGSTAATLATVNLAPGTFGDSSHSLQLTIDANGRVTSATAVAISGGSGLAGISALTGDVTASGSGSVAATLAASGVTAGTYGDATHVPQVTFDAKGRATGVSSVALTGGASVWGAITGTLSDQTDLATALAAKLTDPTVNIGDLIERGLGGPTNIPLGTDGQVLTVANGVPTWQDPAAGTGGSGITQLTGDGTTPAGSGSQPLTLATVNSGPGACGDATHVCQMTTNEKGLVTAQTPIVISGGGDGAGISALTGDVTASGSGSVAATLAASGVAAGTYGDATHVPQVTFDAKGRATGVSSVALTGGASAWGAITGTLSDQTDLATALAAKLTDPTVNLGDLIERGVGGPTNIPPGSAGQVLTMANGVPAWQDPAAGTGGSGITQLTGDGTTPAGSGSQPLTLATVSPGPGTFGDSSHSLQMTVDGKGRVTSVAAVAISGGSGAAGISALTGDVTASGSGSVAATLAASGVTAGTYGDATHVPQVTFDAKGRATGVSSVALTGGATAWGAITGTLSDQTDLTTALAAKLTDPTVNIGDLIERGLGGPNRLPVGTDGQVLTVANGVPTWQDPAAGTGGGGITQLTGDGTTPAGSGSQPLTLATVNSGPGACGDATHVCQMTTNEKGLVTAQTPIVISGGGGGGSGITQLTGDVTTPSGSGSQPSTLATVNSNAGTFGDSTTVPVITVNAKGLVIGVSTVTISGGGGGGTSSTATAISSGRLSAIPVSCSPGAVYFATDQPALQQEYQCSATNVWTQLLNLGGSGALAVVNGSLDIVTTVIPRVAAANSFTGLNTFSNFQLSPVAFASLAACSSSNEGTSAALTDSTTNTWGATISGGGSSHVKAYCDGTNWTVTGQ